VIRNQKQISKKIAEIFWIIPVFFDTIPDHIARNPFTTVSMPIFWISNLNFVSRFFIAKIPALPLFTC